MATPCRPCYSYKWRALPQKATRYAAVIVAVAERLRKCHAVYRSPEGFAWPSRPALHVRGTPR